MALMRHVEKEFLSRGCPKVNPQVLASKAATVASISDLGIGIRDHSEHFDEILNDPDSSEGQKADVRESMALRDADGQFVLLWGNDYWLDGTGEVTSS
jgi:hypothetical protein